METSAEQAQGHCLNCGATVTGAFCPNCGQRVRDNADRSVGLLLGEFLSNLFFVDNRFFHSVWYLIRFPSRMTVEYLAGKRKTFISPVTLFLFVNLIYFFVSPLSDYSLSLYDQVTVQPYSTWSLAWVKSKLQNEGLDFQVYRITYKSMSDTISKAIMIINIPMIAVFVWLMAFKKRPYYYDSLIFAFHFFTLLLASWIIMDWVDTLLTFILGQEESIVAEISFRLFTVIIPVLYAIFGIQKFMGVRWYWAIPAGLGLMISVTFVNFFYRIIIFLLTFWVT